MLKKTLMAGAAATLMISAPLIAMPAFAQPTPAASPTSPTPGDRTAPSDKMAPNPGATAPNPSATTPNPGVTTPNPGVTMDRSTTPKQNPAMTATGDMAASAIIGADVKNARDETIGQVQDIFVSKDGALKGVIVGVGGFLGVGKHNVMLSWDKVQLREDTDHDGLVVVTDATTDSLKSMPEYTQSSL